MTRFNPEKVLILYSVIGALFLAYVALAPSFSAVYVAVFGKCFLFGPCWATIYAGTLDTVDNEHTEMAGAVIVMAIVGAAVVPAIQGYIADMFTHYSFHSWFLCSALSMSESTSGVKAKYVPHWLKSQRPEGLNNSTRIVVAALLARNLVSCWKIVILLSRLFAMTAVSRGLKLQTVVDI